MKIGIYGYGNLGRGVEYAIMQNPDMELVGVFTRRRVSDVKINTPGAAVIPAAEVDVYADKIDVMIICGGSATDLPVMTPMIAERFNCIDSFDTHAHVCAHFDKVDAAARRGGKTAIISVGWDPGMFSLQRLYANSILVDGADYTFWGKGVSQGHSDAVRRIEGVLDARQYTVPIQSALDAVRSGSEPVLTAREKHRRVCYVVADEGADRSRIEHEIITMPDYFSDYDTEVHFITADVMKRDHSELPHGGFVIRTGVTGDRGAHRHKIEYSLSLDSNPEFTASVLCAYARAAYRCNCRGDVGCKTVFDIAPALLSPLDGESLRAHML